jgi:hypothetical protein
MLGSQSFAKQKTSSFDFLFVCLAGTILPGGLKKKRSGPPSLVGKFSLETTDKQTKLVNWLYMLFGASARRN